MQCPTCATDLPQGVWYCPNCGNRIPYNVSNERERQREPLAAASLPRTPVPRETTDYGSPPNGVVSQPPSSTSKSELVQALLPSPVAANSLPTASQPSTTRLLEDLVSLLLSKTSETTESTPPSFSPWKANLLLYSLTVVVAAFFVGSVLNGLGMFPSAIAAATSAFGGTLGGILGVLGGLLAGAIHKSGLRSIWLKANRFWATLAGIFTIGVLLMVLFLNADPYLHKGMLALDDPLLDNSRGYNWVENSNCKFIDGAYYAIAAETHGHYCYANTTNFTNFVYQVEMTVVKGDAGAIEFHINRSELTKYQLKVYPQTGSYRVIRYDSPKDEDPSKKPDFGAFSKSTLLATGSAPTVIRPGLKQSNLLAVTVNGSTFNFYVNQKLLTTVSDSSYKQGQIAVAAHHGSHVAFRNAKVWEL